MELQPEQAREQETRLITTTALNHAQGLRWISIRVREIVWESDWDMVALILAVRAIHWGGLILLPTISFTASRATYSAFLRVPYAELLFGVPLLIAGLWQLWAVLLKSRSHITKASTLATIWWMTVGIMYAVSNWHTLAPSSHLITAIASLWLCVRVWVGNVIAASACSECNDKSEVESEGGDGGEGGSGKGNEVGM